MEEVAYCIKAITQHNPLTAEFVVSSLSLLEMRPGELPETIEHQDRTEAVTNDRAGVDGSWGYDTVTFEVPSKDAAQTLFSILSTSLQNPYATREVHCGRYSEEEANATSAQLEDVEQVTLS